MSPPRWLVAIVRWFHQTNTWTVRRLTREPDRRFGWSALSWWGSEVRVPPSPTLWVCRVLIDVLFGPGHCERDYHRIIQGLPFAPNWRECIAAVVTVTAPLLVVGSVLT